MTKTIESLSEIGACRDAVEWVHNSGHSGDLGAAWLACERGDWMLWYAAKRKADRKTIVLAACECARLVLPHTKDPRVLTCIETAESWARGNATIGEVRKARIAAAAYAYAADAAAAAYAYAAYAAYAADAADAAAAAAAYAAAAADAAYADAAYAYAAARKTTLKQCADIVRKYFPTLP